MVFIVEESGCNNVPITIKSLNSDITLFQSALKKCSATLYSK